MTWLASLGILLFLVAFAPPAFADGIGGGWIIIVYALYLLAIVVAIMFAIGAVALVIWYVRRKRRR